MRPQHHTDPDDLATDPSDRCEICVFRRQRVKLNLTGICLDCLNRRIVALDPNESISVICEPKPPQIDRPIPPAPNSLNRLQQISRQAKK